MGKTKTLILQFKNEVFPYEISKFRGAIIDILTEKNILFHNHLGETNFRYSYPLIQYKRIRQHAAIVCLNEGTEAIGLLMMQGNFTCRIGDNEVVMEIESVKANQFLIQTWESSFTYRIRKWLPLNQENYNEYIQLEGIGEKCMFLERILIGNVLSFAKGLEIHFDNEVVCKILEISDPITIKYKNVKMMAFDVEFKSNVSIPDYIGLGKGASLGHGTVVRKYDSQK
jgi:hypothetical protein